MELNQLSSKLTYIGCGVRKIETNCEMLSISNSNRREFGLDIKFKTRKAEDGKKIGHLRMQISAKVYPENDRTPDSFCLTLEGLFSTSEETSDEEFVDLLNINGATALYSIARARIEEISSLTYAEGKIVLPMINIIQFYEDRRQSEGN